MAVPKKYEHINFKPPEAVANAAKRGLAYRKKSGKGGLSSQDAGKQGIGSGVQRAVNLKNKNNIAPETFSMIRGFFSRHKKNKSIGAENKNTPWEDAGHVAWLLWGGDPGKKWVDKVIKQMEDADMKEKEEKKKKASPNRVARMFLADLSPGLGVSDSACDVLRRIDDKVTNPKQKEKFLGIVEEGYDLSNAEAYQIYRPISESGFGKSRFKEILITPHAQYRMDLRGIDVRELNSALYSFQKLLQRDLSQKGWSKWEDSLEDFMVAFVDGTKLKVVFEPIFRKNIPTFDNLIGAKIISVYYLNQYSENVSRGDCGL